MLKRVKKFIREKFVTGRHPFLLNLYFNPRIKNMLAEQEKRSKMTYAEIEAEISRTYEAMFGRKLNWDNPQTYNEKIHVSKVYMPSPLKTRLADKIAVREWISEKIGSEYLIPLLGVYDSFDEIDFDALPEQFVIKCNHDSGSVTLVKDKSKMDKEFLRRKYEWCLKRNFAYMGFEMHYREIKPKIIIEKFMGDAINDYKFQCFNGKPYSCRVDYDRYGDHRRNVYNMHWEIMPFMKGIYQHPKNFYEVPAAYDKMKQIVSELSRDFAQVRVDLYLIAGKIYFGEMTFTNGNGFEYFVPDEWDYKLGELWPFDNSVRKKILAEHSKP